MRIVKGLWGGELPEFESLESVNDLIGALVNGLWNSLTRHQKRTEPFRLVRVPTEATRAGLASYILMRRQEIDGFVEGLSNGQDDIQLPEKATASLDIIAQLRAMLVGAHTLVADESKIGTLYRHFHLYHPFQSLDILPKSFDKLHTCGNGHSERVPATFELY